MSNNSEFREFFIRHTKVNTGSKPDQEPNYPIQYNIGTQLVFNRFLKGDYPSEGIFTKLFNSLTFKKNIEDTATTTAQGLVRTATDTEAANRTSNDINTFTNTVQPHQLSDIVSSRGQDTDTSETSFNTNGLTIYQFLRTVANKASKKFFIQVNTAKSITVNPDTKTIELIGDNASPGAIKLYGTDNNGNKTWLDRTPLVPLYKIYVFKITQVNTAAPTGTVLENTIGNIVWSWIADGHFRATCTGAFPTIDRFWSRIDSLATLNTAKTVRIAWNDANSFDVFVSSPTNGVLYQQSMEIRVYNVIESGS